MNCNIEVEEQYLLDLINKIIDNDRYYFLEQKDLIKKEIFETLKKQKNNIIIRARYGGFNSNAYFTNQIKSAFAGMIRRKYRRCS
jgi:hypothetical protein